MDAGVCMSLRNFFSGLYRFFTWPFRMIWRCFSKKEQVVPEVIKPVIKIPPIIPDGGVRVLRLDDASPVVRHTKFKPLFLPAHFGEAKNDKDFKETAEKARKKAERIKYRKEMIERIKKMDEEDGIKPKPKPQTPTHDPDSP